jgi:hypothetical protein
MKSTVENIHFGNSEGVECGKIVEIQLRWSCYQRFFIYRRFHLRLSKFNTFSVITQQLETHYEPFFFSVQRLANKNKSAVDFLKILFY